MTLLSFVDEGQSPEASELSAACRRVISVPAPRRSRADRLRTLFSRHPDLARRLWSPEFERALTALLHEAHYDLVHIEGLELAPYLPAIRHTHHAIRIVYDAHNAECVIQRRALANDLRIPARWPAALYSWLQLPRLRRFEAETCRAADAVTCVSEDDAAALQALAPALSPVIVPNGIDVAQYAQYTVRNAQSASLVFTGKMDYRPNIDAALWFARDILPRIRTQRPEVQFCIVGQKPPGQLRQLNGRNGVKVTGAVEDAPAYIADCRVYVAPLRMGGGTRFKLLEAMALARPIVATGVGAEGFAVESGRELILADTPADFARAVLGLLADQARAESIGRAGLAFARSYDWTAILPRLEALHAQLLPG